VAQTAMTFPRGREIVLGVAAGIAAYKSCDLLRRLQDRGFLVTVVPTPSSLNFVGRTTWEALSGRPVRTEVWEDAGSVSHVSLGDKADLLIIAPATADLIARIASGRADDLLTTTVLATSAPILFVPAMHPAMWLNAATQENVETLRRRGYIFMEPEVGRLTGRDSGVGRFPETTAIINKVLEISQKNALLVDKKILVTAGGTREALDPVRFLGNRSSGRQGLAIAYESLRQGAEVTLIAGDTVPFELEGARVITVESAEEMFAAMKDEMPSHDVLVMSAAVADARPVSASEEKIKKASLQSISLLANPDLIASISKTRRADQVLVGFAAETREDFESLGFEKLNSKSVDLLYVTNVSGGAVFGEEWTSGSLLSGKGVLHRYEREDKFTVARDIVNQVAEYLKEKNG